MSSHFKKLDGQLFRMLVLRFAGTFGSGMLSFAIGLYILKQTGSALSMGISLITGPLVTFALTPFVGYLVDNRSHKVIMIISQVAVSLALAAFAIVFHVWPAAYFTELIVLIIALQITDSFLGTAVTASLVTLFPAEQLQQVNSLNQSVSSLATFLAPVLGSVIYSFISLSSFALVEILFELVALVMIIGLRFDAASKTTPAVVDEPLIQPHAEKKSGLWANFRSGFQFVWHSKLILVVVVTSCILNFFVAAINVGQPFVLVNVLKLSNQQYGFTESAFAVGMFFGGLLLSRLTLKKHPLVTSYLALMVMATLLAAIALPLFTAGTTSGNTGYYLLLNSLLGIIMVFVNTPLSTYMQQMIPAKMQGRVFALSVALSTLLSPLGTLFYGAIFDGLDARLIFIITGALILGITLLLYSYVMKKRLLRNSSAVAREN